MDPFSIILGLGGMIFAGGGIWAWLSARATSKAANQQASTADWSALMNFWQAELVRRDERANHLEVRIIHLEEQREDDLDLIERLENHIWEQLPPPPPKRRRRTTPTEGPA